MEWLRKIDKNILLKIQNDLRNEDRTKKMKQITSLADKGWFWIAMALFFIIMKSTRKEGKAIAIALLIGGVATNLVLKPLTKRPRPYDSVQGLNRLLPEQQDWSFPSGHTTASFAASGIIYLMISEGFGAAMMALASTIAYSRMYLGVHYLTDVMAGISVGLGSALIVDAIV